MAEFDLDHLDLLRLHVLGEMLWAEMAGCITTTKVARTDFPNQIATVGAMVTRDRTFTRVMRESTAFSAKIQCQYGVGTQRAKTHGRNIEPAHAVGLLASAATDFNAKVVAFELGGCDGVVDPFVSH